MLCEILKVGELRKSISANARTHTHFAHTLNKEIKKNQDALRAEMHIVVCKNANIQRHKYTQPLTVKMKAAIMPCNCAARSSLFSDAPRPHGAPFQPNMPPLDGTLRRERDAVPTSTSN